MSGGGVNSGAFTFAPGDVLNYRTCGSGNRHLVFLHGFAASLHTWDDLIPFFPPAEFTLHRLDLKGHGGSSKPGQGDYSARHNARIVAAYIRSRKIGPVSIIGHSYGGVVALFTALDHADCASLVLIGAPAFPQKLPPFMNFLQRPVVGPLLMAALPSRYIARRGLESAFHRHERIDPRHISRYAGCYGGYRSAQSLANTVRQMIPPDFARIARGYRQITQPVLLLWGENDRIVRVEQGRKLHDELQNSQFAVLPDCGHNPHEEQSEATYAIIRTFLDRAYRHQDIRPQTHEPAA